MQKVKVLHSYYMSFNGVVGKVVSAFKTNYGWMIPVGESVPYDEMRLYRDESELPPHLQEKLFFADWEVDVVSDNPFAFWNKLKSGDLSVNWG